mmetsp:Transcript_26158/g.36829  ORF Transcript_26158/g.36829 Transcript_26158/m.36829 type:complete len:121 (-) Transcript_26158:226-588(-)
MGEVLGFGLIAGETLGTDELEAEAEGIVEGVGVSEVEGIVLVEGVILGVLEVLGVAEGLGVRLGVRVGVLLADGPIPAATPAMHSKHTNSITCLPYLLRAIIRSSWRVKKRKREVEATFS